MTARELASNRRDELDRVGADLRAAVTSAPTLAGAAAVTVESDPPGVSVTIDADATLGVLVRPTWRGHLTEADLPGVVVATVHAAQAAHVRSRQEPGPAAARGPRSPYAPDGVPSKADLAEVVRRNGPLALVRLVQQSAPAAPAEQVVTSATGHASATRVGSALTAVELAPEWLRHAGAADLTAELGEVLSWT